jgi:hypothetical protein
MNKQHIISEIKRTAEENGGVPLGKDRFLKETGIKFSDWYGKFWVRWGDALIEAGYEPNIFKGSYNDEHVIEKLISLMRELGHYPVAGELRMKAKNDKHFPTHNVFSRLGKKSELAQKVIDYCGKRNGLDDVIKICEPITKTEKQESEVTGKDTFSIGYVYLMKSGRYYKIGRSNFVEKRNYEIGIKLPEELKIVHKIKTDDPTGIESYWHKRFEEKRKSGEWFDLSISDVNAFKRRKFM